ncbi:MAG TPA: peptide-methionine (R)-S-oxide reductase MsrB [Candidatus Dormibacteraeota bacterium]|jgi:peptide-methionine (R)-S-oxide reductase|nr:peptide-methionine (R)-S-oxide reductase MsrB [Candidatus Dormibacteraeota bacterium]
MTEKVTKTDQEWRDQLTEEQYAVLRRGATERAGTGQYVHVEDSGQYLCAGCGAELFDSDTKYDSHSGWPSFSAPHDPQLIEEHRDFKMIIPRTEVRCARCGGHLGHVFDDGPDPTGQRYCINSAALRFARTAPAGSGADEAGEAQA